jgi:hypothetical protein
MGLLKFDIRYPNGHRDLTVVEGERALIGSASHCEVRLPMDQAAYEHLVIEVSAGTVRAEARASEPPATINGMPLTTSAVTKDAMLGAGNVRIFVHYEDDSRTGEAHVNKEKGESSPLVRLVALVLIPLAGYMMLAAPEEDFGDVPAQEPQLFPSQAAACTQTDPTQALVAARDKQDQAIAKRERMPFAARDGIDAVNLFDTAAACFQLGGDVPEAEQAKEAAKQLRETLIRDFRTRRLRLTRMLAVEDYELAAHDVQKLQALTQGKSGPFVNWLAGVKRQLVAKSSTEPQ